MKTHVIFILDESGSMLSRAEDVRGGFNGYVETLRADGNEYRLTVMKFGTNVRALFVNLPLDEVPLLTVDNYMPLDSTALYDAIGAGVGVIGGTREKPYGEEPVIFLVQTDGMENASRSFTKESILAKIKGREEAGNWTFVYLGADQDAWAIAGDLGFAPGNVMSYTSAKTAQTFQQVATATSTTAGSGATQARTFFTGGSATDE